jgi:biotin operon repressor
MENRERVLNAMKEAGKPVRPGEVADTTGIDKKDISKIIKALKKEGKIFSPKQCFYSIAE